MPARLNDIIRVIRRMGGTVEPGKGSHQKASLPGGRTYPLPAHNGEKSEISDKYIRGMCRSLGLDEDEFRALL